jgi:hypothetical protein
LIASDPAHVPEASVCDDDDTSTPQISAEPRDACSSPHRMRSAVVLPAPAKSKKVSFEQMGRGMERGLAVTRICDAIGEQEEVRKYTADIAISHLESKQE